MLISKNGSQLSNRRKAIVKVKVPVVRKTNRERRRSLLIILLIDDCCYHIGNKQAIRVTSPSFHLLFFTSLDLLVPVFILFTQASLFISFPGFETCLRRHDQQMDGLYQRSHLEVFLCQRRACLGDENNCSPFLLEIHTLRLKWSLAYFSPFSATLYDVPA